MNVLDAGSAVVVSVDAQGMIISWNRAAASRLFGNADEDLRGKSLTAIAVGRSARALDAAIAHCRTSGEETQLEVTFAPAGGEVRIHLVSLARAEGQVIATALAMTSSVQAMLDTVPLGLLFFKPDGQLYFNRRAEQMFGVELSPTAGSQPYADLLKYPDGRPVPREELVSARVMRSGETVVADEFIIDRPDGSRISILGSAAPVRDASGRVTGLAGAFVDISDRRRTHERMHASLQSAPLIAFNQDRDLRCTWVYNPMPPLTPAELLGKTDYDVMPPSDAAPLVEMKRGVLKTGIGARGVFRVTRRGVPSFYDLTVEPLRDAADQIIGITCVAWDVSEQQQAEERHVFLVEAGAVLLGSRLDLDAMMMHVARLAVRDLADICRVDVLDPPRVYIANAEAVSPDLVARIRQVELGLPEVSAASHDAETGEALRELGVRSMLAVPLRSRGEVLGAFRFMSLDAARRYRELDIEFARDFARLAALAIENAQLHHAARQALASRDEVVAVVAHDLLNPINAALLNLDVFTAFEGNPEQQNKSLRTIRSICEGMNRRVQDMLDVARIEAGTFTVTHAPVDVVDLVDEVIATHQPAVDEASLHLHTRLTQPVPAVVGDRGRLLQLFDHLIANAIKFTPAGGTITIGSKREGGELILWVADTGTGVAPDQLGSVFERRGAGLGLAIVKGIVGALGGRVWVESQPGSGSTFYFTVPRVPS